MASDVAVRASRETDIPAITAIYADAVLQGPASFEIEPPSETAMAERRRLLVAGGFPYFVADRYGRLVG